MPYSDIQIREIFHFLFLENLIRVMDPRLFVLKGGVNLRFFLKSPRYSEDMDLDILGGSVSTLKKNCYKILENPSFKRALATYGIIELRPNDPSKAKQTETTQRFRVRLVNRVGEEFPTKIEFSRRAGIQNFTENNIDPEIAGQYKRLSYRCQHFNGSAAVEQKIRALAGRPETQARDVFDLYVLYLGHHFQARDRTLNNELIEKARENALSISYHQYRDQVEEYLTDQGHKDFGGTSNWSIILNRVLEEIKMK
jgi:hypothetical protein